jgi:hypothetical protein
MSQNEEIAEPSKLEQIGLSQKLLLPILLVFLVPGFSLWFFQHATDTLDENWLSAITESISGDSEMSPEERQQGIAFFQQTPVSRILASSHPDAKEMQAQFADSATDYLTFRWMIRLAIASLLLSIGSLVLGGLAVLTSGRSQLAQYWCLALSWHGLKLVCLFQSLAQGAMLIALSFWISALWFQVYIVKLIILVAIVVVIGVGAAAIALFTRLNDDFQMPGRVLDPEGSPGLFARIAEICAHCGTATPDQVAVGIDDNFFVTENTLKVGGQECKGRTLYLSLSLLRVRQRRLNLLDT